MDETSQKIIDATMRLIRDKGYVATTTKDIANLAGVNECTLFRKFKSKKILHLAVSNRKNGAAMLPLISFTMSSGELQPDLEMFMNAYMDRITPDFVNLSIGLRAPQLYEDAAPFIMKIPQAFISFLAEYFRSMEELGKLPPLDCECLALTIFSATFGYTFLKASFGEKLSSVGRTDFIKRSVELFISGIPPLSQH